MAQGNIAGYREYKKRVFAWFDGKAREVARLRKPWKPLRKRELDQARTKILGPGRLKADEDMPLRLWMERAAEARGAMKDAIANGNYRNALLSEGHAEFAEFQAGMPFSASDVRKP
jgi:hypothetical protein